jgi:hypothetical protein
MKERKIEKLGQERKDEGNRWPLILPQETPPLSRQCTRGAQPPCLFLVRHLVFPPKRIITKSPFPTRKRKEGRVESLTSAPSAASASRRCRRAHPRGTGGRCCRRDLYKQVSASGHG